MNFSNSRVSLIPLTFGFLVVSLIFVIPNIDAQNQNISQLEYMLEINPNDINVKTELAVHYYHSNQCEKALILIDEILKINSNSVEMKFAQANCFKVLGLPEKSLLILNTIDDKYAKDPQILLAKGNAHVVLKEFKKAGEYYKEVLAENPDNKSAMNNMIILSRNLKDLDMAETYLEKLLGENPTASDLNPSTGNMPYSLLINDSKDYSVSAQIQIRNSSNELIAIVESEKILFIPHPMMYQIIDKPEFFTGMIENDSGVFEVRKIIQEYKPVINSYFMDRVTLHTNGGHLIFFAFNMAIPIEDGDHTIIEWTITKKIN